MKPVRTFIFFVTVALWLLLLALIFPREVISVSPSIQLKFLNLSDLSRETKDRDRVVKNLVAASSVSEDPEADFVLPFGEEANRSGIGRTLSLEDEGHVSAGIDSEDDGLSGSGPGNETDTLNLPVVDPANADSLKQSTYRIRFAEGGADLLDPFFSKMEGLLDGSVCKGSLADRGPDWCRPSLYMAEAWPSDRSRRESGCVTPILDGVTRPSGIMFTALWAHLRRFPYLVKGSSGPGLAIHLILLGERVPSTG